MRILLVGEYSGFYRNLGIGLMKNGHEITHISNGDSWKNIFSIKTDCFPQNKNPFIRYINTLLKQKKCIKALKHYDVVQIVNPTVFMSNFDKLIPFMKTRNYRLINILKSNNKSLFLSVAGHDYQVCKFYATLPYHPLENDINTYKSFFRSTYKSNYEKVINIVDGIIPVMYTYAESYRNHPKVLGTIQLPIDLDEYDAINKFEYTNKIEILHGINRPLEKGTKYILEALRIVEKKYPSLVNVTIADRLPFTEYIKLVQKSHIIIDQALTYDYGMNAIIAMSLGKIVLSGNEQECSYEFRQSDIPIINILPSVEDIISKIEIVINNPNLMLELSNKSTLFVRRFHDAKLVSNIYIDNWVRRSSDMNAK